MLNKEQIQECEFTAKDRVNEVTLDQNTLRKDDATVLTGDAARLDSMGFVNFVVALEESLAARGLNVSVVEEINVRVDAVPKTMNVEMLVEFLAKVSMEKSETPA